MLIINLTPDGEAIKDSELLEAILKKLNLARVGTRDLTWDVDREDTFVAAQWLLKQGRITRDEVRFTELGIPKDTDVEHEFVDHYGSDIAYSLLFTEEPDAIRKHVTWDLRATPVGREIVWLKGI